MINGNSLTAHRSSLISHLSLSGTSIQKVSTIYFTPIGGIMWAWGETPSSSNSSRWAISQREKVRVDTPAALASSAFVIAFMSLFFYSWFLFFLLLAVSYWLLAIGCWLLAVGYWLLAIGRWLITATIKNVVSVTCVTRTLCNFFRNGNKWYALKAVILFFLHKRL